MSPKPGHLFRLSLFALFLALLCVRIGVELVDGGRFAQRAKQALESTPDEVESKPKLDEIRAKGAKKAPA